MSSVNPNNQNDKMVDMIFGVVLSIFLPPLAVLLSDGLGEQLVINILLCIVGLPFGIFHVLGVVHALWRTWVKWSDAA